MNNWNNMTIGDLTIDILGGGTPSTKNNSYWQGNIPWITSKWLNSELYLNTGEKYISDKALNESATHLIPQDNIIFATRVGVGKAAINKIDLAINQDLAGIIVDKSKIIPEFLVYQVKTSLIQNEIESYKRGATIKGITRDNLKSLKISLPQVATQKKIVSILFLIQNAIKKQDALVEATISLKKSLTQTLFTEGLNGEVQKETEIGSMPASWNAVQLGEVLTQVQYGLSAKAFDKGNYPMLRMTNQLDGHIISTNLKYIDLPERQFLHFKVDKEDVLFNRTNSIELVGKTSIFTLDGDYTFASYLIRLKTNRKQLNPNFLTDFLNTEASQKRLKGLATRGVSQANISGTRLRTFIIPLPPLEEQREIAEIIDQIDKKIRAHKTLREKYSMLFSSLLDQLMSGELNIEKIDL